MSEITDNQQNTRLCDGCGERPAREVLPERLGGGLALCGECEVAEHGAATEAAREVEAGEVGAVFLARRPGGVPVAVVDAERYEAGARLLGICAGEDVPAVGGGRSVYAEAVALGRRVERAEWTRELVALLESNQSAEEVCAAVSWRVTRVVFAGGLSIELRDEPRPFV